MPICNVVLALSGAVTARGALGRTRAACEDWPRLHPFEGRQNMSTDIALKHWGEEVDEALLELMQLQRDIKTRAKTDPTCAAVMTGFFLAQVQSAAAKVWELVALHEEGPRPRETSSVPRARTESRSDHALCETINIRWVPLPLSDLAQVALNDSTLTGNAREWSTPYLQALTTHEEGQTHYGADTVESLIAYALSGMVPWRGESAETVKAMFESYLPACQREG